MIIIDDLAIHFKWQIAVLYVTNRFTINPAI